MMSSKSLLTQAIDSATIERLRTTIKIMCQKSADAHKFACHELLVSFQPPKSSTEVGGAADKENANLNVESSSLKRKREGHVAIRYAVCIQCEKEFDTLTNGSTSCEWHDGRLEVDWDGDFWADHDENCHGIIDSEDSRKDYPEGFRWDCCNRLGSDEKPDKPCLIGPHRAEGQPEVITKRRRTNGGGHKQGSEGEEEEEEEEEEA